MDTGEENGEDSRQEIILNFIESALQNKALVIASNRGPLQFSKEKGILKANRGSGGLVTAVLPVLKLTQGVWVASAMTSEDMAIAQAEGGKIGIPPEDPNFYLRFVLSDKDTFHKFYNIISNPLLWFIQHYLWGFSRTPTMDEIVYEAWEKGYKRVNKKFAQAIEEEIADLSGEPLVMLHDYHLYLCSYYLRKNLPQALIHHFIHIPWPQPDYWKVLPDFIRTSILEGLLSNDVVCFHSTSYVRNFMWTCEQYLSCNIDFSRHLVRYRGGSTKVRANPLSIRVGDFKELAQSEEVQNWEKKIRQSAKKNLLVRIDRADLSKNIIRGFQAYDLFLTRYPAFKRKVTFLALLHPSRQNVDEYRDYLERLQKLADEVNARHKQLDWLPINLVIEENFMLALAAYKQYDVLLVNSVFDGLNLVAKEAPTINETNGVVILSENTGAFEQLKEGVLAVNPFDIVETAERIYEALTMLPEEKKRKAQFLKKMVERRDILSWLVEEIAFLQEYEEHYLPHNKITPSKTK